MDAMRRKLANFFTWSSRDAPADNDVDLARDVIDIVQQQQQQMDQEQQQQQSQRDNIDAPAQTLEQNTPTPEPFNLSTGDKPTDVTGMAVQLPGLPQYSPTTANRIDYQLEFVNFMNRNTPTGFAQKFENMLPFLGISFVAWPSYWLWRGYHWQTRRQTERIGLYIQRTFQHAKLMQVAILGIGLFMVSTSAQSLNGLAVHDVSYDANNKRQQQQIKQNE